MGDATVSKAEQPLLFEVWDAARHCVLACFTAYEAAAAYIERDGMSTRCEIRKYAPEGKR